MLTRYVKGVAEKVTSHFEKGEDVGSVIEEILAIFMKIIGGCAFKPSPQDLLKGGGIFGTIQLNNALRGAEIRPLSAKGRAIKKAMLEEATDVKEAELFLSQCCPQ